MEVEPRFSTLAGLLARFEPGDLCTLSEIMDVLASLRDRCADSGVCIDFIDKTLGWIKGLLHGADPPDFAESLGRALALLQGWDSSTEGKNRGAVEEALAAFAAATYTQGPAACGDPPPPKAAEDPFQREEILGLFLTEARERLAQAQQLILLLESRPGDATSLAALFRVFHTIKGECGFMHLSQLGELTHRLENVLDLLRGGRLALSRELVDLLLAGIDRSGALLEGLAGGTAADEAGLEEYLGRLEKISSGVQPGLGALLVQAGKLDEDKVEGILAKQRSDHYSRRFGEIAVKEDMISPVDLRQALIEQSLAAGGSEPKRSGEETPANLQGEIIKVGIGKVNFLVDMIGELTIALGQVAEDSPAMALVRKITKGLRNGAMELRTDTMRGLFGTVRRIVRDLSHSLGKNVEIEIEGEDLEVDRNLIKKLEEPLMHLVRNALDHGLDKGGRIRVAARRKGSTIVIAVEDDGAGLDRDRILVKAVEKGLVTREAGAALSEAQVFAFIFQAGFSTRATVSQVSGRGVGLDIVQSMVRASRGTLSFTTARGRGTSFVMTFPISTAIIDGLVVRVGENTLIIPTNSVVELLKLRKGQLSRVGGEVELVSLRDKVMPVIRLGAVLGIEAGGDWGSLVGLVVENSEHQPHFLAIDEVIAKREIVVKPLGPRFKDLRGITAGTVLPGGAIGLVIDIDQLVGLALGKEGPGPLRESEEVPWK